MNQFQDFSFAIMNGECHVTPESIDFRYDRGWKLVESIFGKPSQRRSVIIAICLGIPLLCVGIVCFASGLEMLASYPAVFGLFLLVAPFFTWFSEQYVYPDRIARSAIESVTGSPPGEGSLGSFTISFVSQGSHFKTMFCLPVGSSNERVRTFRAVAEAFSQSGLLSNPSEYPFA